MSDAPENLLTVWSELLADALCRAGVRDLVVSPGSRSTPFLLALLARRELRAINVLDERSAAFVALGMARANGTPVALLCTSGSAPAHWYPAVLEASLAAVPLILLSADRPSELQHCGAAQTLDQIRLFGDHVRFFADLGNPDPSAVALRGMRRTVSQAVELARSEPPGPVHLNLRAAKPLEPLAARSPSERGLAERATQIRCEKLALPHPRSFAIDTNGIAHAAQLLREAKRVVLVAGPLPASAAHDGTRAVIREFAVRLQAPLFAEATSQLRFQPEADSLATLDLLLARPELEPELVVQIGGTLTSAPFERFVAARPDLPRIMLGNARWIDPHGTATLHLLGSPAQLARALLGTDLGERDASYHARCREWHERAQPIVESAVPDAPLHEASAIVTLIDALPARATLSIGNSLSIRVLDRYATQPADLTVLSQRGLNGIDGLVSGAIGAAIATGRPGALILGDLSFQHDLGALASAHRVTTPLAILVLQNAGGRIFEMLPIAKSELDTLFTEHFLTPQRLVLEHAAAAFAVPFASATSRAELDRALRAALARPGVSLIEAVVPSDGVQSLQAAIDRRLAELR